MAAQYPDADRHQRDESPQMGAKLELEARADGGKLQAPYRLALAIQGSLPGTLKANGNGIVKLLNALIENLAGPVAEFAFLNHSSMHLAFNAAASE